MPRKTPAAKAAVEAHDCLKLKLDGLTVREIAAELNIPKSTVQDRIDEAMQDLVLPVADEVRQIELARLDRWQNRLEKQLDAGEDPVRVVPIGLKVQERRSRYLGLDAPERVQATFEEIPVDPAAQAVLARARAARDARLDGGP